MQLLGNAPLVLPVTYAGAPKQARRSKRPLKAVIDKLQRWSGLTLTSESPPPNFGEIVFDQESRQLRGPTATAHLSPNELLLLLRLAQDRGRVLTHAVLLQDVWGPGYADAHHLLHDTVSRLRHRFAVAGASVDPIETVHGVGYRLRPQRSGNEWGDIPFAL
jgi:DNA-binding response OmpR family regulator